MPTQSAQISRVVVARMNPDEDLLEALSAAVAESNIKNGLILNGVGSLNRYRVHVVGTPDLPTQDVFFEGEGPYDILTLSGMILDGRVHAHMTFSNTEKAMGGHVEEGCRILTFVIATLAEAPELNLADWDQVGPL